MTSKKRVTSWIAGTVAIFLGVSVVAWFAYFAEREEEIVLWADDYWARRDLESITKTEETLTTVVIPKIDFEEREFDDALEELLSLIEEYDFTGRGISLRTHETVPEELRSISLKLENVPASEALRYLTALAELKFIVDEDGSVVIAPINYQGEFMEEGWFDPGFNFVAVPPDSTERIDIRDRLEASAFVTFGEGTEAYYDPVKQLVWARHYPESLEMIEVLFATVCYLPEPTWKEKLYLFWMDLTTRHSPAPVSPLPPTPPSSSPVDPFAVPPSGPEPDPFGR